MKISISSEPRVLESRSLIFANEPSILSELYALGENQKSRNAARYMRDVTRHISCSGDMTTIGLEIDRCRFDDQSVGGAYSGCCLTDPAGAGSVQIAKLARICDDVPC